MSELDLLRQCGIVGGGGAGFPLWKKLSTHADILLINGAECEPVLNSDRYLMQTYPEVLIRASLRLGRLIGAKEVLICLKSSYHSQINALQSALSKRDEAGIPLRLHLLPAVYPVGDEQAMIYSATGRIVPPGKLPGHVGCTVVSVSTAINALLALEGDKPVTDRFFTVAGEIKQPGVYRAPVGMPLRLVLEAAGGPTISDYRLQLGGPMMGEFVQSGSDPVVTKTLGGILVLPRGHVLEEYEELSLAHVRNRAKSACIQCRYCTDLCPRFLLGHPIYPHLTMRAWAEGDELEPSAVLCMECGICELYACPMGINPRRMQQLHKQALRERGDKLQFELGPMPPMAEYQQAPSGRVAAKVDVLRYEFDTPETSVKLTTQVASIPLKQHIGVPAVPCVAAGDRVRRGDTIARMPEGALGADIHASIVGRVERVGDDRIVILCEDYKEGTSI